MSNGTVEMISYQLKAEVTEAHLAATHEGVNEFLKRQPGFCYRSLSRDDQGQWFDVLYWQDMDAIDAADAAFMASQAGQALLALIDEDSVTMRRMDVVTAAMSGDCSSAA